ncbi:MAG: DUF4065 domain-containing protein [Aeromicrobium sp.]|nr:DUF4065 domain-containing protein [Aeromicrobium sp.]
MRAPRDTVVCPECLRATDYDVVERQETHCVRGEEIVVDAQVAVCRRCGQDIGLSELDDQTYGAAYAIYRSRHDLLQPEQIRAIRSKYGLGQKAFARLLGWGDVTLARYEGGSLQSDSHDTQLRLAENPQTVRELLTRNGARLSPDQQAVVSERLQELSPEYEALLAREDAASYSGFSHVRKLEEMVVFFSSQPKTWRTKLNKLLFYADFLHHRRFDHSISGARYVRMQYGPVPADFYALQAHLVDSASIDERPSTTGECAGTIFVALRPADMAVFTETESQVLAEVAAHFRGWSAKRISEFSHEEPAWLEAENRETIPYERSRTLRLQ